MEKGDLISSYDEDSFISDRLERLKEEWDETHPKEPLPDDDTLLDEHVYKDSWLFQDYWDMFTEDLHYVLKKKSPYMCWESPEFEEKECFDKGIELIDALIDFEYYRYGIRKLDVYDYGPGILVDAEWKSEKIALPECEEGYFRDWERDGICVRGGEDEGFY